MNKGASQPINTFRRRMPQSAESWKGWGAQSERKLPLSGSLRPMETRIGQDSPQKENSPGEHVAIRLAVINFGVTKFMMSAVGIPK